MTRNKRVVKDKEEKVEAKLEEAVETKPEDTVEAKPEETGVIETPEEKAAKLVGIQLAQEIEKYEIPEVIEVNAQGVGKTVLSIHSIRIVGEQVYAKVLCDDRCTYDVPISLKKE